MTAFYEVKVVNMSGVVSATLTGATVEQVTRVLNEPGSFRVRIPVFHPDALLVQPFTELQVWRNGALLPGGWGVAVQRDYSDGAAVVWTCAGLPWYWTRLVFGPVGVNYLLNPLFATNLANWAAVGATATWSTAVRIRGAGTARLVSTTSGDNYLAQDFTVTTGPEGLFLDVAAWYLIDPAVAFVAPAAEERGLYVQSASSLPDTTPKWEPITMNATVGKPQRVETGIHLAPSVTATVHVRLYSPRGAIHWGATSVTAQESVSSAQTGTDATDLMRQVAAYAESGGGKSSHNIAISAPALSGVSLIESYQFMDLPGIFAVLKTFPARGLADFDIVTTATTRTFTTYAPRKGSYRSAYGITVPGVSTVGLQHRLDGQQTVTKTIRRGAGSGSDRELGVATDTSHTGGLVLEDVADAPPEVGIDGLDALATTDVARLSSAVATPQPRIPASAWLGNVDVGDTVPVTIDWGAVQEASTQRVISWTLDPPTDLLAPGLQIA